MSKDEVRYIKVPIYIKDPIVVSQRWFDILNDAYRIVSQLRPIFKKEGKINNG